MYVMVIVSVLTTLSGLFVYAAPGSALETHPRLIVAQGGSGQLALVEPASGKITTVAVGPITHGVGVLPDGKRAYAASFGSDTLSVVDLEQQKAVAKVNIGGKSHHIAVSPDGR